MDKWELIVCAYDEMDKKKFGDACACAKTVLTTELPSDEIDWFLDTLLLEPVNLLKTVAAKWTSKDWSDLIRKAMKLLADVIVKYPKHSLQHSRNIITLCEKPFDLNTIKQSAIKCLTCLVRQGSAAAEQAARKNRIYINSLANDRYCKAPIAELVGEICRHYPELVGRHITSIWRVYLNLLNAPKSDTVVRSLMLGIDGVLESFGEHLPTAEFGQFYKHLVSCSDKYRCEEVYLTLLGSYADLFREHVAADASTRDKLWKLLQTSDAKVALARRALIAVYKAIRKVDAEASQDVLGAEVEHRSDSSSSYVRYTALRILHSAGRPATCSYYDSRSLEHSLRHARLTYDQAESILWRLESNADNESRLLKTALAFHHNLPEKYLKEIAVCGLIQAPDEVRTEAVSFLLNEMTNHLKDEGNIDKYVALWKLIFDYSNDEDVLERIAYVFNDFLEHLQYALESFVEEAAEDVEELPDKLRYLLSVSTHIIPLAKILHKKRRNRIINVKERVSQLMETVSGMVGAAHGALLAAVRVLHFHWNCYDVPMDIPIDCCSDDRAQYEFCLALATIPPVASPDVASVLNALQFIFSHADAETSELSRSIRTLETLITTHKEKLNPCDLKKAIREVVKIQQRNNFKGRDASTLRRELLIFIGKYGKGDYPGDFDIVNNRNRYMTLSFPVLAEGISMKIHLQYLKELAIKFENPGMLQVALDLISANAAGRQLSEEEQADVSRVACVLLRARAHARVELLEHCGETALALLLRQAASENRVSARRAICAALQMPVFHTCTRALFEKATSVVSGCASKPAILDIMEMLLNIVKGNNTLVKTHLPDIILTVAAAMEMNGARVFKSAAELMIDKIELFQYYDVRVITVELLKSLVRPRQNGVTGNEMVDVMNVRRSTKIILDFLKQLNGCKRIDIGDVKEIIFEVIKQDVVEDSRVLYVLSMMRRVFEFDADCCRRVLEKDNFITSKLIEGVNVSSLMSVEGILKFSTEYAEILSESYPEETLKLLSNLIKELQPKQIVQLNRSVFLYLKKYVKKSNTTELVKSFEWWCRRQSICSIETTLLSGYSRDIVLNRSLKILLDVFDITDPSFADLGQHTKGWVSRLHTHYTSDDPVSTSNDHYVVELMQVALRFMTVGEVKAEIQVEGFAEKIISALFPYLTRKPYLLMDEDMAARCGLLNHIVKYAVRECRMRGRCDLVLELVDELWPVYDKVSDFKQKHSLLVDIARLPQRMSPGSNPMRWLTDTIRSEECTCEMRVKLIGVLPAGEDFKSTWSWFAGQLPARLAEVRGDSAILLGALLDALPAADCSLLDSISQLVSGDTAEGWWDEALEACTLSLAARNDISVYETIYNRCWDGLSLGVCNRLMVPLLRCSSVSVCEEFFSRKLQQLLEILSVKPRQVTTHYSYHKCVVDYTRAFILLKVAFEMLPEERIKSPRSLLYSKISERVGENLFYLVKEVGNHCVVLIKHNVVRCMDKTNLTLKNNCLLFHCENYNCLSAATWCRAPTDPKFYEYVFDRSAWTRIVDPDAEFDLPIRSNWQKRKINRTVSVALDGSSRLLTCTGSTSARTRTFRSTLSENPLEFDEGLAIEEQEYRQDVSLLDNVLNRHPCAATLTACYSRAGRLPHTQWLATTATALAAPAAPAIRWLLAQAICNCEDDLKEHAAVLRPALLKMVADTSEQDGSLNGLHVDVLNTIIRWRDDAAAPPDAAIEEAGVALERLVRTCIRNGSFQKVLQHLLQTLDALLEMYGEVVRIGWDCLAECIQVHNKDLAKAYYQIVRTIMKRRIHVPELLPALLNCLESKQSQQQQRLSAAELAQLFGRAAVAAPHQLRHQAVLRYRKLLREEYGNLKNYINLIYNAQDEIPELCDEEIFEKISNVVFKVVNNRAKCLEILSTHMARLPGSSPEAAALLHAPELLELVNRGDGAALHLVRSALPLMTEELRKRVVIQSAAHCTGAGKVRSAACGVLVRAMQLLFGIDESESKPKRPASFNSPLLKDDDLKTPLAMLGLSLASDPSGELIDGISKCFGSTNTARRFCDCFIVAVHLPATLAAPAPINSLVVLLNLFFKEMRENDAFKQALIGDGVMENKSSMNAEGATSKETSRSSLDPVEMEVRSVDEVLEVLLQFSKKNAEAASAFSLQIMSALKLRTGSGSDFGATMGKLLVPMLNVVSDLTPFAVEACRLFIDDCCSINGFKATVEGLLVRVKGTEGQELVETLHEEMLTRTSGFSYFHLGKEIWGQDEVVTEMCFDFTMEGVVDSFDKLSNWEDLTFQQRRSVEGELPPLLVDIVDYRKELDKLKDFPIASPNHWLDNLTWVYHNKISLTNKSFMWFSKLNRWPRSSFSLSATVDAWELTLMESEDVPNFTCEILPADCLAQWAARIQIRAACVMAIKECLSHEEDDNWKEDYDWEYRKHLSHALKWCACANEKSLSMQVLRYTNSMKREELKSLPWLLQDWVALRKLSLERNELCELSSLLKRAECETPSLVQDAPLEDVVGANHLILLLRKDLNELSKEKLKYILNETRMKIAGHVKSDTSHGKRIYGSMVKLSLEHYDTTWDKLSDEEKSTTLIDISEAVRQAVELNVDLKYSVLLDVLLNRLSDYPGEVLTTEAAAVVLGTMERLVHVMDDIALEELTRNRRKLSSHPSSDLITKLTREGKLTAKFKQCLQLVADPKHSLQQYCKELLKALMDNDEILWRQVFTRMKDRIFENHYAGLDYQVLAKHQETLYNIMEFNVEEKERVKHTLNSLMVELKSNAQSHILTHLCPTLTREASQHGREGEECLSRLLMLPRGVNLVKFEETVAFASSARRPGTLRARLSDGTARRLLVKSGERLQADACALRFVRSLPLPDHLPTYYQVTPLAEDSALIEYLEDHVTVLSMVQNHASLSGVPISMAADDELVLKSRDDSVAEFQRVCAKVPAHLLRSAIEQECICVEEFIRKKRCFEDSLAVMTLVSWLLGLKDRHLGNVMYCRRDGSVRCVDWNPSLQHGRMEPPPARLTRAFLAVCRLSVLESRLQQLTAACRDSNRLFLSSLRVSYKGIEGKRDELEDVADLIRGVALPHEVSIRARLRAPGRYTDKYLEILRHIFSDFGKSCTYTVEQQVTNLLRHCTDPQILGITRSAWEPWI